MSAETNQVSVDMSVMNFFHRSTAYTAGVPAEGLVYLAHQAGYKGLEWMPNRTVAGAQLESNLITPYVAANINSLHQSYRSEKTWTEAKLHENPGLAKLSFIMLPEKNKSLDNLETIQRIIGLKPTVLYVPKPGDVSGTNRAFAEKLFQPTPEIMRQWGIKSVEELIVEAKRRRYTGFCVDLFHMRAQGAQETGLGPWQETLPELLPFAKEIHVAAGRVDIRQGHIDTMQELQDLLKGTGTSDLIQMLRMVRRINPDLRFVTEIPAEALHTLRNGRWVQRPRLFADDHRQIVQNIKDIAA